MEGGKEKEGGTHAKMRQGETTNYKSKRRLGVAQKRPKLPHTNRRKGNFPKKKRGKRPVGLNKSRWKKTQGFQKLLAKRSSAKGRKVSDPPPGVGGERNSQGFPDFYVLSLLWSPLFGENA